MLQGEGKDYADSQDTGGYDDWRLPTVEELFSLVDYSQYAPASSFPGMPGGGFWSSSVYADDTGGAWIVYFDYGYVDFSGKYGAYHVRCVRRGPLKLQRFDAGERIVELEAELEREKSK